MAGEGVTGYVYVCEAGRRRGGGLDAQRLIGRCSRWHPGVVEVLSPLPGDDAAADDDDDDTDDDGNDDELMMVMMRA